MHSARFCLFVAVILCLVKDAAGYAAYSQERIIRFVADENGDPPSKFENGFQIFWRDTPIPGEVVSNQFNPEARVKVVDGQERESTVCNISRTIRSFDPKFAGVSIYDVSARKPGFIAVAAVYLRDLGNPIPVLLFFDWNGSLLKRVQFSKRPAIRLVKVVSADRVWALNDFDAMDRSRFAFSAFDRNGAIVREAVSTRRTWSTGESRTKGGQTSFGVQGELVWAWLPSSRTFVAYNERTGKADNIGTGFPSLSKASELYARQCALLPDGRLLMDIGWLRQNKRVAAWFVWSAPSGWNEVRGSDTHRYLWALEGSQVIFGTYDNLTAPLPVFRSGSIQDLVTSNLPFR